MDDVPSVWLPQVIQHPLRPLRENLKCMLRRECHHHKDFVDPFRKHVLVKKIAHGVHENPARLFPAKRVVKMLFNEFNISIPSPGRSYKTPVWARAFCPGWLPRKSGSDL